LSVVQLAVYIEPQDSSWHRVFSPTLEWVQGIADCIHPCIPLDGWNLGVMFTDDKTITAYNAQRGKSRATNVLAWCYAEDSAWPDQESYGDIVISGETALQEAQDQAVSLEYRLAQLLVHGVLHALGYDHERSERDELIMQSLEEQCMQNFQKL